jgi:thiazole synthase ThiGH ThiG subunit
MQIGRNETGTNTLNAVRAGREAWEAGLPMVGDAASATSPLTGFLGG